MNIDNLRQGDIISVNLGRYDGITPKDGYFERRKFFVVLGISRGYALLGGIVFNSSINRKLPQSIHNCHIPVSGSSYGFLEHDSYFDCSKLIKPRFSTLERAELIGFVNSSDMEAIMDTIRNNPRIARFELDMFGLR